MILSSNTAVDTNLLPVLNRIAVQRPVFDRIYGRLPVELVRGVDALPKDKDTPRRLPLYTDFNGKTRPVVPDEKLSGLLFFIATGPARTPDWRAGIGIDASTYTTELPLSLIAWWKRDSENTIDSVKQDLLLALGQSYDWVTTAVDDQIATGVFRGLDYDFDNHSYLVYPYAGLRIDGVLSITETVCC